MALPDSRGQTVNPGDDVDAQLLNDVQDAIVDQALVVNRRIWRHGFEARVRMISGALQHDLAGNIQSGNVETFLATSSFDLNEHDSLVQVVFRVKDNGTDRWQASVAVINQNGVAAVIGTSPLSSAGGVWEDLTVTFAPPRDVFGAQERFRLNVQIQNTTGATAQANYAEITTA